MAAKEGYPQAPPLTHDVFAETWLHHATAVVVARREGVVAGAYYLKPNQPGLGSHVANAAFMVLPLARGLGLGRRMGEHCLAEARRLGFLSMQFNFVVATNEGAVRLWKQLGFTIVGTLPQVFRHPTRGRVDAYVMFRHLGDA